jgi:small-conductance mechanosensitive channel
MRYLPRALWQLGLVSLVVASGTCARADEPGFPTTWFRLAQKPEPPATPPTKPSTATVGGADAHVDMPSNAEAIAHDEQQSAVLNLLAANLADAEQRRQAHLKEKSDWEAKLEKLSTDGVAGPRPYSFLDLDKARDNLASERQNASAIADAVTRAKETVAHASDEQNARQRDLRHAKDQLDHNQDAALIGPLTQAVADAEHELTAVGQLLALRKAELANLQLDQQVQALRQQYAKRLAELYQQDAVFTPAMRNAVLSELDARGKAASARAKRLTDDLSRFLQPQWYQARERLDNSRANEDEAKLAALAAEVQAKDLAQQLADYEIGINVTKLDRINDLHTAWQRRYAVANSTDSAVESAEWLDETKAANERLRVDAATLHAKAESVQKQLDANEKKLQAADKADTSLRYWLGKSNEALEQERRLCEKALAELDPARRVFEKLEDELTGDTISATAVRWLAQGRKDVELVWDYEVANVQDRPITVGRIIKGVFFFLIGIYVSRMLSRAFGRRLLTRMGVNASASSAFQSLAFYLLVLLFTLFALKLVEVPLTAFTVLGGAVALGVGFGSQNIVNNFISGLILLVERPVKVGDLIQLENLYGNVEHIGARSTRVKTGENLDIIVPNSTFLETNVVNWTLSDNNMRTHVTFGVMYGSSTGKVTHLALKAAANHDRVFDRPAPFVIFNNFGDNALEFELHFWVSVRTLMERRQIESDIRFNIDHLFREAGIVLAYPQRDVHLFADQPLRVQMTPTDESNAA